MKRARPSRQQIPKSESIAASYEILTVDEVNERYKGEWVVLRATELDEFHEAIAGQVLVHGTHDDAWDEVARLVPHHTPDDRYAIFAAGAWVRSRGELDRVLKTMDPEGDIEFP